MKTLSVLKANYMGGYKLEIIFDDQKKKIIDFSDFLNNHNHPQFDKYKKEENFKKFSIENGNVVWGKNWDMIFPVYDLYRGRI